MDERDEITNARLVRGWYRKRGKATFSQSELQVGFKGRLDAQELATAVGVLIANHYVRARDVDTGGRRARHYEVNPAEGLSGVTGVDLQIRKKSESSS